MCRAILDDVSVFLLRLVQLDMHLEEQPPLVSRDAGESSSGPSLCTFIIASKVRILGQQVATNRAVLVTCYNARHRRVYE